MNNRLYEMMNSASQAWLMYSGLSHSAYEKFRKSIDYSEYGGAPLLGVRGVAVIAHGGSNVNAIKNAIRTAAEFAQGRVNEKIESELERSAMPVKQASACP